MDPGQYLRIFAYLHKNTLPTDLINTTQINRFKNFCKPFIIKNNYLYKIDRRKEGNHLRVIRRFEMEPVLYMVHNDPTGGHLSTEAMFNKIRDRYYWPQLYEDIRNYVKTCDSCQRRGRNKKYHPLHPIPVHSPFYQIGIDFVGPLPLTSNGNKYIIVAMDYLTKWPEAQAVTHANAEATANFLYETIICRHGCPQKILSDRGAHFKNQMIEKLMQKFQIKHLFSTPYHPQTNGLVERFNRTLCESLAKLGEINDWDKNIAPVLFAYRTSKHSTTGISPFYLMYGREPRLPIDEMEVENTNILVQHLHHLVDDLPLLRETAKDNVTKQQTKQKDNHDRQVGTNQVFFIGDKVLYYRAEKEKQWTGKLEEKWKGPFYIHAVGQNGSYKLRDMAGRVLKAPVNTSLLKPYYSRQNWVPTVVINHDETFNLRRNSNGSLSGCPS